MELPANSTFGYHIMDWSRHTVTKYLSDERTHGVINNKTFKCLGYTNDQLYEIELVKAAIQRKAPIIVEFFSRQSARLKTLELIYKLFHKACDVAKFEELKMDKKLALSSISRARYV